MKICFILPSLSKKGPNIVVKDIIDSLQERLATYEIDVFYFNDSTDDVLLNFGVPTYKIRFFTNINFEKYDIVHSHMLKPDLYVFFYKLFTRKLSKVKTVTTLHQLDYQNLKYDYNSKLKAIIFSLIWRLSLSLHDRIVCLSNSMTSFYKVKLFNKKISTINNGRNLNPSKKKIKKYDSGQQNLTVIGTTCGLTYRKGLDQVIKAMEHIENIHFYIAGTGPEEKKLRTLANDLNLTSRVHFVGFVEDVSSFLTTLDIFILPSRAEGFPLALIEAMSLGLGCISSDIDVIKETFTEYEVAQFKLEDIDDLKRTIDDVMKKNEMYANAAYNCYLERFTSSTMANNYLCVYKQLLK